METTLKHCAGCDPTLSRDGYHRSGAKPDGLQTSCRACRSVAGVRRPAAKADPNFLPQEAVHALSVWRREPEVVLYSTECTADVDLDDDVLAALYSALRRDTRVTGRHAVDSDGKVTAVAEAHWARLPTRTADVVLAVTGDATEVTVHPSAREAADTVEVWVEWAAEQAVHAASVWRPAA